MGEYIANTGRTITITPQGGWTPGGPSYTHIESGHIKLSGSKAILSQIVWTVSGCSMGAFVGGGGGNIQATASNVKMDGMKPMRETDEGSCSGTLKNPNTGATIPCSCKYKITNAGQSKVKAE